MALILSAIVLITCVLYKEVFEAKLKRKLPFPFPMDLIIVRMTRRLIHVSKPLLTTLAQVIAATCACTYLDLGDRYGVAVMGSLPVGYVSPGDRKGVTGTLAFPIPRHQS